MDASTEPAGRRHGGVNEAGMAATQHPPVLAVTHPGTRYEFKYLVHDSIARAVARAAQTWYAPDPHGNTGAGQYVITSLYLDTPRMDFYRDRQCQRFDRVKARVRTYGPRNEGPIFLELKRRFGDTMVKTRSRVPADRWMDVLGTGNPCLESWGLTPAREAVVRDFAAMCVGRSLRPVVSVRYDREAYIGRTRADLRLTVDRRLRFAPAKGLVLPVDDRQYRTMDTGLTFLGGQSLAILEIKFTDRHPLWLEDLLARFDLARQSFSKYLVAVDTLANEPFLNCPGARRPWIA